MKENFHINSDLFLFIMVSVGEYYAGILFSTLKLKNKYNLSQFSRLHLGFQITLQRNIQWILESHPVLCLGMLTMK